MVHFPPKQKSDSRLPPPPTFKKFIAKTLIDNNGIHTLSLYQHALLSGIIAKKLISLFSLNGQKYFSSSAYWYASVHDVGKINPFFYARIAINLNRTDTPEFGQVIKYLLRRNHYNKEQKRQTLNTLKNLESIYGFHAGIGSVAFIEKYNQNKGIPVPTQEVASAARIIELHHGWKSNNSKKATEEGIGGESWQRERELLLEKLREEFNGQLELLDETKTQLWSGLVSLSDWLASSQDAFKIMAEDGGSFKSVAEKILKINKFCSPQYKKALSFEQIFKDTDGKSMHPRPLQIELPNVIQQTNCCVVRCPTGTGKTEAALYSALQKIYGGKAHGIYFALPTILTADKIYERLQSFLDSVLAPNSPFSKAFLLHGDSDLVLTNAGAECLPGKSFFNSNRTKLLGPFAAGTIDQALLAILPVKYNFIRLFGLADKVVILDEVHSYDAYVSSLIKALIKRLQEVGATVIILSATLTTKAMCNLLGIEKSDEKPTYPSLSYKCVDELISHPLPINAEDSQPCRISITTNDPDALAKAVQYAKQGCQVLWIENTVNIAQQTYFDVKKLLQEKDLNIEIGLMHSRFIPAHRRSNEDLWMKRLGKNGYAQRKKSGSILIGTQVLEQSLDFDADVLFTRLAPIDFIIQRIGRLWRFKTTPRPKNLVRQCYVLAPKLEDIESESYRAFGKSALIYEPYTLARTLEVLTKYEDREINLPNDVPALLETAYVERDEHGVLAEFKDYFENGCRTLHSKGRKFYENLANSYLSQKDPLSSIDVPTRFINIQRIDCLLLADKIKISDDKLKFVLLNSQEEIIINNQTLTDITKIREYEHKIKENIVQLTINNKIKNYLISNDTFKFLKQNLFAILTDYTYNDNHNFLIAVVKKDSVSFLSDIESLKETDITYNSTAGWYYNRETNER